MLPDFNWPLIVVAQRRELEFLEVLADGAPLTVNGKPWRQVFARLNKLVSDPIPWHWLGPAQQRRRRAA